MKKPHLFKMLLGFLLTVAMVPATTAWSADAATAPDMKNGKPWRIAYYEGGAYIDYQKSLVAMVQGLMDLGWIEKGPIPDQQGAQTAELWQWLADSVKSPYLVFVKEAHYTANWDKNLQSKMAAEIIDRLKNKKDIDLIIAAGTKAGQALADNSHNVPTLVISTSDPIGAGIIRSAEDSGYDHVHARVDPKRFKNQLEVFHDVIGFKRLGVAYENSPDGRTYGAIDQVEAAAAEHGFEVLACHAKGSDTDKASAQASVLKCFEELAEKNVDAIYVTRQIGVNADSINALASSAIAHKIPTFSQSGSSEVKSGILLSLSHAGFEQIGKFYAETVARILNGSKPRALPQIFEAPPRIAINLKAAEQIGIIDSLPMRLMMIADEIYQEIQPSGGN